MLKLLKVAHLLGLVMFFGSILGHVSVGLIPAVKEDPRTALIARQAIDVATTALTMPGLLLLLLSGTAMVVVGRLPILRTRWLALHAVFGLLILLNAIVVLYPLGQDILAVAAQVSGGALPIDRIDPLKGREAAFGAANMVLCLAALILAVVKPRFGGRIRS